MSPASWCLSGACPLSRPLANSAHQMPKNLQNHVETR